MTYMEILMIVGFAIMFLALLATISNELRSIRKKMGKDNEC